MHTFRKTYTVYNSPFNPCPPMTIRTYETPPQLYMTFQPPGLPQFSPAQAFHHGTLWPALFAPYESPHKSGKREEAD
ncbi:spore coat associated protein CotJA [Aneurinibacillus uraniidurans]|nr:spore coat associated protein CotJA [Aneurinibacillus sp. B1]WCN37074.1 spore coat associated protein CotJA [Aneurinibacillus sp. B1]